jgi:hypothetical protein
MGDGVLVQGKFQGKFRVVRAGRLARWMTAGGAAWCRTEPEITRKEALELTTDSQLVFSSSDACPGASFRPRVDDDVGRVKGAKGQTIDYWLAAQHGPARSPLV